MKYVIVGNSRYAVMLFNYVKEIPNSSVKAFTVQREYIDSPQLHGLDVVPYEDIETYFNPEDVCLLLGVGYTQMNDVKEKLFHIYKEKGFHFGTYAHPSAVIPADLDMGEGNVFFEGTIIQRGCHIGTGNVFFARTLIAHDCTIGDFNSFSCASLAGNVTVKNKCFVGMGTVISENLIIEDQVFIGANAYVNCDVKFRRAVLGEKAKIIDREISKRIL